MNIRFFYKNTRIDKNREVIITSFANLVAQIIELPNDLDVCLYPFKENIHGGIDAHRVNRIAINANLPYDSIPEILTHELIHVNQKFLGTLKIVNKTCYWRTIPYTNTMPEDMPYEEYLQLPWERDVQERLESVVTQALQKYNSQA